ncbi:maleylacetate reductase and hydroxyquinol 1,2-dioxygenase domain-containing protein [Amycolatopsis anabasis]|uniref:maleylacetate reductase and hydroxyquinol 1,2-dioxygenase domain-containing protein n=1 Tax=Amycolatopsis anabasis TaxID=1840409 RepID=UPI00131D6E9F|nr:maleylacetate reductase and hydroxyquinol 1,2-dioxygenase domain-containing protein [Amycolatopsis anabasis]
MKEFVYTAQPGRVVFGTGTLLRVPEEVDRLGRSRVLLLAGPRVAAAAELLAAALGSRLVVRFAGAAMHTPVEVTEQALEVLREHSADCVVALGGGSTTGLAKALAVRTDVPQVIVPTTYAGSEMTPLLGETEHGRKMTRSSPAALPEVVVYDVELTLDLPRDLSVTSGLNALAHAVEALYAPEPNPVTDAMALEAVSAIARALPAIAADPSDVDARTRLLRAAWLAGTCLGAVGMGLHHKLCHTLGGSFGLPHAPTHAVVLPHAIAYNAPAVPEVLTRVATALGAEDAAAGVFDLLATTGGPVSLRELGLPEAELARAAELATATPYPNPRPVTPAGIEALLADAWHGRRPGGGVSRRPVPDLSWLTDQVVASFDRTPGDRERRLLTDLVRQLHGFAIRHDLTEAEWARAIEFLTRTGQISSDIRQEFILLSDTLGLSSVVDLLTNSRTPDTTPSAVLGPFYVDNPPEARHGDDIAQGLDGTPLWVDVQVTDQAGQPIPAAVVDVWQSDKDGHYDLQLPDLDGPVLRARLRTGDDGRLTFWSIVPPAYPIPDDGPVGRLLAAVGRHPYRAPHVHFMISAPGFRRLVTQLFVAGGDYLDSDTVFGVKEGLIVDFEPGTGAPPGGRPLDRPWRRLTYTFHLARI